MRNRSLVDEARKRAEEILLGNASNLGLLASRHAYQQVWTRDAMISGLGLLLIEDPEAARIHSRSLKTLRAFQSPLGNIPHHVGYPAVVDPALVAYGGKLSAKGDNSGGAPQADTGHAGCIDSFYVAALVEAGKTSVAEDQLGQLATMNRLGRRERWEFNEWIHGQSGKPMGFAYQSWSAAMYIYAYESVKLGKLPLLFPSQP